MKNTILAQFLRRPLTTGAICPSSLSLAKMLIAGIGIEDAACVAELGPGTGAITGSILKAMRKDSRFFAVELNQEVIAAFRENFPDVTVYNESAANLTELLRKENIAALDAVISGLPWAIFPDQLQDDILSAIVRSLHPGGYFTTFAYVQGVILPCGLHFRKRLNKYFSSVSKSPVVWKNFPPAFVYRCQK